MTARYWDAVAPLYDSLYDSGYSQAEDRLTARFLARVCATTRAVDVLDAGCGTGLGQRLLQGGRLAVRYVGCDTSFEMLRLVDHEAGSHRARADFMHLPFRSESFDVVMFLSGAASFVDDLAGALQEARRITRPTGGLVVSVLSRTSLRRATRLRFGPREQYRTRGAPTGLGEVSVSCYSPAELRLILRRSGWHTVAIHGMSVLGGVLEVERLWGLDRLLARTVPGLSHALIAHAHPR